MTYHDALEEWESWNVERTKPDSNVCRSCVLDVHLWTRASEHLEGANCDFCGHRGDSVTLEALAEVVDYVVDTFYVTWSESGAFHDEGQSSELTFDILEVAEDLLAEAVDNNVRTALAAFVSTRDRTEYGWVRQQDVWGRLYEMEGARWTSFIDEARHSALAFDEFMRGLGSEAIDLLRRVEQAAQMCGLFRNAAPALWRCRAAHGETEYRAAKELGSPPADFASENRMTPEKDPVFYGSTSLRCAVAEVVQGQVDADIELWAGQFAPSRSLYYLDVCDAPHPPSPFATGARDMRDSLEFLDQFAHSVSEPKDEANTSHYMPTQVFTAYLRSGPEDSRPDAVRFASSLDPASANWVVFVDQEHCVDGVRSSANLQLCLDVPSVRRLTSAEAI